ncbi:hypothetical protein K438DRAFT_1844462 [Mycena galopus ATCC 62051]|nr:hypothetical protein K438DRAFT_1844462 [Mycena galopus ATCC 62051]
MNNHACVLCKSPNHQAPLCPYAQGPKWQGPDTTTKAEKGRKQRRTQTLLKTVVDGTVMTQ